LGVFSKLRASEGNFEYLSFIPVINSFNATWEMRFLIAHSWKHDTNKLDESLTRLSGAGLLTILLIISLIY